MLIKNVEMLVTNVNKTKGQNNMTYYKVGLLSFDDGQKFDVSVDEETFNKIQPMTKLKLNLNLTNSNYGMRLSIVDIVQQGECILVGE